MNKLKTKLFIVLFFLLLFISKVSAAPSAPWVEDLSCGTKGFKVEEAASYVTAEFLNQFLWAHKDKCIYSNKIGYIVEDENDYLIICKFGYTIPYNGDNQTTKNYDHGCCPNAKPYFYTGSGSVRFCAGSKLNFDISSISSCTQTSDVACLDICSSGPMGTGCSTASQGNLTTKQSVYFQAQYDDSNYIYDAVPGYSCPLPNCFTKTMLPDNTVQRKSYTAAELGLIPALSINCVAEKTELAGKTCYLGSWMDSAELAKWKDNMPAYLACNAYKDDTSKQQCLVCYETCPTCSWSDAGCFDLTQNGLIIRIFQIGLGTVGGLGLIRFFQAIILRQTADPSKIQESYDIITALIVGLVVLLGSIVLLRFITIDVLRILPADFLK